MTNLEKRIYAVVRGIPKGRVATYAQVALALGDKNLARVVGNALHKNPLPFVALAGEVGWSGSESGECEFLREREFDLLVPCHRVVSSAGKMGANFGLGGAEIQAKMLAKEGVFVKNGKVDMVKYGVFGLEFGFEFGFELGE